MNNVIPINKKDLLGRTMMSQSKFYMGYSRWIDEKNRYETWNESVERVMNMHREKYKDVMTNELEEMITFAENAYKEKRVLGAQRALQFGGEQLFKHNFRMYNCFAEETRFITDVGIKAFSDFDHGDKVNVKTHKGNWKKAVVKNYGKQKLNKIVLGKTTRHMKTFYATAEHRWILEDGTFTDNLQEGDTLHFYQENEFHQFSWDTASDNEKLYWCYGYMYGDGTIHGNYSHVRLCAKDVRFVSRFEEFGFKTSSSNSIKGDVFVYTGKYQKTLPDIEKDGIELVRAFVNGYLSADGGKGREYWNNLSSFETIYAKKEEAQEFIRNVFPAVGVHVINETITNRPTNFGVHDGVRFNIKTEIQHNKFAQKWKVYSIEETDRLEDVWCLEVEDDQSFVLEGGISTGNCLSAHADRPDFFQEAMYLLLCGGGVGFSVQKQHIAKLPPIKKRYDKKTKVFTIPDSIEGWADAFGVLLSSYFVHDAPFPEYYGCRVHFDFSKIRPKGALISGGFKAPGPDGLRASLIKCEQLLDDLIGESKDPVHIKPITAYDFVMHMADAVLSGGVRRCLPKGTKVFMQNGVKNIEEVKVGEKVLTPYGYYSVKNNFQQGKQKLIEIKTQDGSFKCTPNHKMPVLTGTNSYKWVQAQELTHNDMLITNSFAIEGTNTFLPLYSYEKPLHSTTCTNITIPALDEDMAWFIGLFQGDGYVNYNPTRNKSNNKSNNAFTIVFPLDQHETAIKAKTQAERFGVNAKLMKRKGENSYILKVVSKQLSEYFYTHVKQATTPLSIPDFIWNATNNVKLAFVAGLMDADGSVKTKPIQICTTVYKQYAKDIQTLLYSCGITTRFKALTTKHLKENWQPKYCISPINAKDKFAITNIPQLHKKISNPSISRLGNSYPVEFIKEDSIFSGKLSKMGAFSTSNITVDCVVRHKGDASLMPTRVLEILEAEEAETFDIEVDEVHQFYANGYLTHNSATICMFSKDDEEMLNAKTGDWFVKNPQRGRSNNSAMIKRDEIEREEWAHIMESVKQAGEPGFIFTDNLEFTYNPCVTGDTLVTVKDHNLTLQGNTIAEGTEYQIPIKHLVELFNTSLHQRPMIKTYNTSTNKNEWKKLTNAALTRKNATVFEISCYGTNKTVKATANHEFWTTTKGYVKLENITTDDYLLIGTTPFKVNSIIEVQSEDVYDITVSDNHNFYANGILVHNCVEIGMLPVSEDGESGFQSCNLCEINGGMANSIEDFMVACEAASIIGTLQAGYTDFKYLSNATKKIIEREALIGVSITGWMNNPDVLFDEQNMINGATLVKNINKKVAKLIGINPAARTTCVKPSGNASTILATASGIHGEHSPLYFRNVQMNDQDDVLHLIEDINPEMVETSVWSLSGTDKVVSFPIVSPKGSIYKDDLLGVKQLDFVKKAQQFWVEYGTNIDLCTDPNLRHNVSNTITVDDWDEVEEYIYNNRQYFAGISLLSSMGDKAYPQAPFTEVLTGEQIMQRYGEASMFASGLIVEGLHAYNNNLWLACDTVNGWGLELDPESSDDLMKRDWVRRAKKYAINYFNGDILEMTNCLKDSYNLHKWLTIKRNMKDIDFSQELHERSYTDVDTMGSQACAGGACEINF